MPYGKKIKEMREQAGITATDLSRRLGWSQSKISKIESGTQKLSLDDAEAIANAIGIDMVRILKDQIGVRTPISAMTLGDRIKNLRQERGWTQEGVASRIGVFSPQVSGWETGKRAPSPLNTLRLSKLFGVSVDFLIDGEDGEGHTLKPESNVTIADLAALLAEADRKHPGMAEGFLLLLEEGLLSRPEDVQDMVDLARIMRRRAAGE